MKWDWYNFDPNKVKGETKVQKAKMQKEEKGEIQKKKKKQISLEEREISMCNLPL